MQAYRNVVVAIVAAALRLATTAATTGAFHLPRCFVATRPIDGGGTRRHSQKPGWLDDAMGTPPPSEDDLELSPGLAGFSLSKDRSGFYALMVSRCGNVVVPVLVSPTDKDQVTSPVATTLVQLAGGLDLGTAVFPPDALLELVADKLLADGADDGEEDAGSILKAKLRQSRLSLSKILAVHNNQTREEDNVSRNPSTGEASVARNSAVRDSLVGKVLAAVTKLPGLHEVTRDQVEDAVHAHADKSGDLDRDAFSNLLQTLRSALAPAAGQPSDITFALTCAIISGDSVDTVGLKTASAVTALGLGLRSKVEIDVSPELAGNATGTALSTVHLLGEFPAFRSLTELREDAAIMDGFIPTMFAKTRNLDNDDKAQ